jgi:hypothetical protein
MQLATRLAIRAACLVMLVAITATASFGQNILVNPGFEGGPVGGGAAGWNTFGNVFTEAGDGGCIQPYAGGQILKTFGNWWGVFNVSGAFQEFPITPGATCQLSAKSRYCGADPMVGAAPDGNWVVQKIAFFDAGNNEIGAAAVESKILDGTYPADVWIDNAPILGVAPAGAVKVQAFILYLQPLFDGGAAQIDNVDFQILQPTPARTGSWGALKTRYR